MKYTLSCREDQRLCTEAKSFRNTATQGGRGGGSINPTPLYHGEDLTLRVRPRVKEVIFYLWCKVKTPQVTMHTLGAIVTHKINDYTIIRFDTVGQFFFTLMGSTYSRTSQKMRQGILDADLCKLGSRNVQVRNILDLLDLY